MNESDRNIEMELKPQCKYDERAYVVSVWFNNRDVAEKYRAEAKYKKKSFELLPEVREDKDKGEYRYLRLYQIKY